MSTTRRAVALMAVVVTGLGLLSACGSSASSPASSGSSTPTGSGSGTTTTAGSSTPATAGSTTPTSSGSSTPTSSGSSNKGTIAFIPGATGVGFYTSMKIGVKAEATKLGYTFIYQGSPKFSPSAQIPVVNAVCTKKPDLLLIAPTDPTALRSAIQTCMNLGVKVVTVDTGLKNTKGLVSEITSNNLQGGAAAADFIAKKMNGKGEVGLMSISATATTQVQRAKGFKQEMAKKYPGIKIQQEYTGQAETKSVTAVRSMLSAHPDMKGFFGVGEPNAEGAAQVIKSEGKIGEIAVVGYDADPSEVALLKKGSISALVIQKPAKEGRLGVKMGVYALSGQTSKIKKSIELSNVLVTHAESSNPKYTKYYYKAS